MEEHDEELPDPLMEQLLHRLSAFARKTGAEENVLYDSADVKQKLNISERTLQRWRKNKVLQFSKIGGKCYYSAAAIRRLMR